VELGEMVGGLENVVVIIADTDTVNVVAVVETTSDLFIDVLVTTTTDVVASNATKVVVCDP
jgi:hypothetical protein